MANAPPVLRRGEELQARHLLLGNHIPQSELHPQTPVILANGATGNQRKRIDQPPIAKARAHIHIDLRFNKGDALYGAEQPRTFQIRCDDLGQFHAHPVFTDKIQHRNGQRLDIALCDINLQRGTGRRACEQAQHDHPSQKIKNTHKTTLPANPPAFCRGQTLIQCRAKPHIFRAAFQTAGTGEWRATRFQPRRGKTGRPIAHGS